jgi:hypothetical protein
MSTALLIVLFGFTGGAVAMAAFVALLVRDFKRWWALTEEL